VVPRRGKPPYLDPLALAKPTGRKYFLPKEENGRSFPARPEARWDKVGVGGKKAMGMFMGEYRSSLDDKGRLSVPAAFRAGLGEGFVVTRGLDRSLFLFPAAAWEELAGRLRELPLGRADARSLTRYLFASAQVADVDSRGRMLVPSHLRAHAAIQREAVWVGVGNRVELWSVDGWQAYLKAAQERFESLAESLVHAGL
jgi:MraZ protein